MDTMAKNWPWFGFTVLLMAVSLKIFPENNPPAIIETQYSFPSAFESVSSTKPAIYEVAGYYSKLEKRNEYDGSFYDTSTCDTFITNKNENDLTLRMAKLIEAGNTVNAFTENGDLRLNISLNDTDEALKKVIQDSSVNSPVLILMSEPERDGKGAGPCTSFVKIEGAK
jgi:hypothetical protein